MVSSARKSLQIVFGGAIAVSLLVSAAPALAQDASLMSCEELWYARNEIYARNGFCFKTARAQSAFGPACFPPFGKLTTAEKRRVDQLQSWERRRACPA